MPVAIYTAKHDKLIVKKDSNLLIDHLGPAVVDYAEMNGGHNAFMVGRDQTWFQINAVNMIKKFNPL